MKAWMSSTFGKFAIELRPLIQVRIKFLLNILKTSSPKGNDRSPESQYRKNVLKQVKDFFNWSRAANSAVQSWTSSNVNQVVTLLQICNSCQ